MSKNSFSLYEAQQAQVDKSKPNYYYVMKMGTGKALPNNLDIPTPFGFKKNGDLKIGDAVFDKDGNITRVSGVYPQGLQEQYEVELTDGRKIICSGSHLWTFRVENAKTWQTKTTEEIIKMGISRKSTQGYTINRIKLPNAKSVIYPSKQLPVDPYVLGAFLGDGCLSEKYLTISSDDEFVVEKIAEKLGAIYHKNSDKNFSWTFYKDGNLLLTEDVFGKLFGSKAINKYIPEEFKLSDKKQRWELVQGLFDTDGSVKNNDRLNVSYSSISEELVNDIREVLYSLGFSSTIQVDERKDELHKNFVYELHVKSEYRNKRKFFSLPRKLNTIYYSFSKTISKKTDYGIVRIKNIKKLDGQVKMTCIMVDNDEHLYLAGRNYIVTHNTVVGLSHVMKHFPLSDVIVIAPKQVVKSKSWEKDAELVGFNNDMQVITTDGVKKLDNVDVQGKVLIVDEAHKFKNGSARSEKLRKLTRCCAGFVFLSGTPTNGKLDDLEMYALYFGHVPTKKQFKDLYKVAEQPGWSKYPIWKVGKNTENLKKWFKSITSDVVNLDDITELPDINEHVISFKPDREYKKTKMSYKKDDKVIFANPTARRIYQRQNQNNKAKIEWLDSVKEEYGQDKCLIFYTYDNELQLLDEALKGYEVGHVNGHEFNDQGDFILIQTTAGSGMTLNDYKHAVWWSLPDSFINFDQSKYRNYRIGQDRKITRDYLVVHGTIDDALWNSLEMKKDFNAEMFED